MKLKPLFISVGILAVVAVISWWLTGNRAAYKEDPDSRAGQNLLAPEALSETRRIVLSKDSGSESTVLQYDQEGTWTLPDYYGLPVDFSKLQTFTRNLLEARIRRLVSRNPERLSRLDLGNSLIVFQSEAGETLLDLEVGKSGPSGGYFVRYKGEEAAYLADLSLYLDANYKNWADNKILSFDPQDISAIEIEFPGPESSIRFHRENAEEDFQSQDLQDNQSVKNQEVKNLIRSMVNARFSDAAGPDEPEVVSARANARKITLKFFQGDTYTLAIGRRPSEPIIEEKVNEGEEEKEGEEDEEKEPEMTDPGPVYIFYECSDPDNRINKIMERAALSYSDYIYSQLPETHEDLIETVTPSEPSLEESNTEKEPGN